MFFIAYAFKGQVHVFAGQVKIVSHSLDKCNIEKFFSLVTKLKNIWGGIPFDLQLQIVFYGSIDVSHSDSFTILGLWVLGLAVSHLQTYESRALFLMTSLQYYCILGLAEIKTLHPRDKIMRK